MHIRVQINLTYDCNMSCHMCIQLQDVLEWKNPMHINVEDLKLAAEIFEDLGIETRMVRLSGGEPTVHPQYEKCVEAVTKYWKYDRLVVCTNTLVEKPVEGVTKYRLSPPGWKEPRHVPWTISPDDLGIKTPTRLPIDCIVMRRCGVLFDSYGFGPCGNANPIGRVLGIDPYRTTPVIRGFSPEMCKHCIGVLNKYQREEIQKDALDGKIEWPSKTYREGIEREKESPTQFKTFRERLTEEE
jgi:hypothetical protein